MDLTPSPDELALVEATEAFLASQMSTAHLHERLRTGADASPGAVEAGAHARGAELGVFSLGLPEDAGGAGCPVVEEALVFRALGRHLAPVGFVASVLAARIAHAAGDAGLRDEIAAAGGPIALALPPRPAGPAGGAEAYVDVLGLAGASHVLHSDGGVPALTSVKTLPDADALDCLDPTTDLSRLPIGEIRADLRAPEPAAGEIALLGTLLTAAMLVGIAEAARDAGVAHAKQRVQFGRPIGVNQAIKHPCADMATRSEAADALLFFAALALRDGRDDAAFQIAAAKRVAAVAARDNARANVQIHGGMGVTWEHDAHLFVTRAHVLEAVLGNPRELRRNLLASAPSVP